MSDTIIRAAMNRQMKKRHSSEVAVAELAAAGVVIGLDEYRAAYSQRMTAIRKQGKQQGVVARLAKQREAAASQARRDALRWPGMSDEQIAAHECVLMDEAGRVLLAMGATHAGHSPVSESQYYTLGGVKIRVSCHELPDSPTRDHARMHGPMEHHIVFDRFVPVEQVAEMVAEVLG